jgi:DtxR family Mn-dependent transcriptional regulator
MPVISHGVDDYLETIYFLAFPIGEYRPQTTGSPTLASRVAEMLGVSRASAGEMLKRLEADGLVERGEQKEAILTPAGTQRARKVVRKHRVIERLLTDFMGYTAAEAHVHADELGGTFSDEMVERIEVKLGYPDRCPHGWPVAPEQERAESRELVSLADLGKGDSGEIVRQAEQDGGLLSWFEAEGLKPGARVEVRDIQPAAGHFTIEIEGGEEFIADRAARRLFVRKQPRSSG